MDIFEGRYFNINRKYLALIGQSPITRGTTSQTIIRTIFRTMQVIFIMPHLISIIVNHEDVDRLMLNLMSFFIALTGIFKIAGVTIAEDHIKSMYESIADNWLTIRDEYERQILIDYSHRGREVTIYYGVLVTIGCIFLSVMPTIPKILDLVSPLARPRPTMYLLEGEFFVDRETYYVELFCCDVMLVILSCLTTLAIDTMYVACTQHCCALYAIIRYRLRKGKAVDESQFIDDHFYRELVHTIELHKKALNFTWRLNDSYSLTFLYILLGTIAVIPLAACAAIAHLQEPLSLIPYVMVFIVITMHLFIVCWPGQNILDHGIDLTDAAYFSEWYAASTRSRKLIFVFMLRSTQPESLSGGGLLLINYETFSTIMRTAISYITVLASFR